MTAGRGEVARLWTKRGRNIPLDAHDTVTLVAGQGIEGDANPRGKRQVTLITEETFQAVSEELKTPVDPALRRANILLRGVDLEETRGRILRLGPALLKIHGETRPCRKMEESQPGLQDALDPHWRGGVYATVLEGGEVSVGDVVEWK